MTGVTIRPYRECDLEACRGLWEELVQRHRELYNDSSIGGETPGLHFDGHLARVGQERVWVADEDGRVVGMAALVLDGDEAELDPLVVASTHQRRGVGRALLQHAVEQARELAVRYLEVRPVARNQQAISFYHGAGFRLLGRLELSMELQPSPSVDWKTGLELLGLGFEY